MTLQVAKKKKKILIHGDAVVKNLLANAEDSGDVGLIPGSGRFPGEGNGNPLQYSCLENPMDRGVWWVMVHGVKATENTKQLELNYLFFFLLNSQDHRKDLPILRESTQ